MSEADWSACTNSLNTSTVGRGVTAGIARPNGGGSFVYGFNSLATTPGAAALFANQTNFAPMGKGGSVSGAIKRGLSGGKTGWAPFLFIGLQGPAITDLAYMLGLEDDDPHRIVLRKGKLSEGLPAVAVTSPPTSGVLAKSTATFENDTWRHLKLDMIVNANGDVVLNAFANDLDANPVTAPVWVAIPGIAQFIDDALAVNSGSAPYTSGRAGYGHYNADVTRRSFFDHVAIARQL